MALAAPIIADLLSLGTYAQDLYERCLLAPIHFREANSELLALQTALSHLDLLTKTTLYAAGGGDEAIAKTQAPVPPAVAAIEAGAEKLAIEGPPDESNGNDAVVKTSENLDVATRVPDGAAPNGVHQITSPANSSHLPPKTRADIAQLAAGCRGVLQSLEKLLEEHQGLNDIPVKPKGRGNGGIMQLFVGRPTGAIDRYKFAQEGVQRVNAIRAKLTYHTGAITLMLTVLGSSSLGRIEGSLSKLETMIAAAAEEKERVHTNNVNYYLLAQQNTLNVSPEKQAYMKQRQKKGMGMGPLEFQNLSEQEYYTSMNMLSGGGGGMRGGGGPRMLKAKGEKQSGGLWGGGHADSEEFFSNINSWSGRPKSSGVLQSSHNRDSKASRGKPKEMGFLGSLSRRNTTGAEMSMSRGSRDESKKREKKQSDDWTDYMSPGWGDLRPKKTTKAQRLMLPPAPSKESPTMSGGRGVMAPEARAKEREGKSSSSKRRERGDGEKKDKAKKRRSREIDENAGRIEELEDDAEEGEAIAKVTENGSKPEREEEAPEDKVVEAGASPEQVEPKSNASVKSKHSSRDQSDAAAAVAKADRHRRKKEKEREREKTVGSGPTKGRGSSAKARAAPLAPPSPIKQKKFSWSLGESQFLNSWEKAEKKPVKPVIAIPVPKKNRSVVNLHGRNRASKGEDGNTKIKSKSSKPLPGEDRERRRQRREQRKAKEGKTEDLEGISEEGPPATAEGKNPETAEKQSEEAPTIEPPIEEKKEEETPPAGESPEVKEGGETAPVEGDVAAPAVSTEDEAAKKERRKKRKEAKEAAEGKEGEKKPSKHHSTHKSTKDKDHHHESSSRSVEKGKEKERPKEHREEKHRDDKEKKDKLRRQNTEPITEKEKKEHKLRSKTAPVGDKAGMRFDVERNADARRKMKEKEAQAQQPAPSLWSKKVLAVARLPLGGQKQEESRRRSGK